MVIFVQKEIVNSAKREELMSELIREGDSFSKSSGIKLHYGGLPFIRTQIAKTVKQEMQFFLYLSAIVTGLIMFLFFRSVRVVLFSMLIIGIVVVWVVGTLALFDYKITLLSGLIPPVIVTIGITNAIYLINKYHLEYIKGRNKLQAITHVLKEMGLAMFLTNLTVAIGFLTLLSTDILVLREFGIVAGINILGLFIVSLIMIPAILMWLPDPKPRHLRHLDFKAVSKFLLLIDKVVHQRRAATYVVAFILAAFSIAGIMKLKSVTYMVDNVPENSDIRRDILFFETNFGGIMPLEIEVNTGKRRDVLRNISKLRKIDEFQTFMDSLPEVSRPISIITMLKSWKQAFFWNNPAKYELPTKDEGKYILRYIGNQKDSTGLRKSFVDSTYTRMRISMQMADIGSVKMDSLVSKVIEPRMNKIFANTKMTGKVTGTTKLFIKGNKNLVDSLQVSLLLAFILITFSMAFLFANVRMIIISLVPNLLALMITAGLMGYLGIPLKASTSSDF